MGASYIITWTLPLGTRVLRRSSDLRSAERRTVMMIRTFRPDRLLTRGEWAQMLAASFELWPSVTAQHFDDVPSDHPGFIAFETLYDHGARRGIQIVQFEGRQKVWCDDNLGYQFFARPDADITANEAWSMLRGLTHALSPDRSMAEPEPEKAAGYITRAQGALLLDKWARR